MFLGLFSLIYLGFAIVEIFQILPQCYVTQHFLVMTYFSVDTVILIQKAAYRHEMQAYDTLKQISNTAMIMLIAVFPINYYKTPECMTPSFRLLLFMYFMPLLFVALVVILFMVGYLLYFAANKLYKTYIEKALKEEIVETLKSSLFDPDRLLAFYSNNADSLQNVPLLPEELVYYKDNFEATFGSIANKFDAKECVICYEEFQADSKAIPFPKCNHLYHYDCIQEWLKKKKACAMCKDEFRVNFARALKEKAESNFLKISPEYEALQSKNGMSVKQSGNPFYDDAFKADIDHSGIRKASNEQVGSVVPDRLIDLSSVGIMSQRETMPEVVEGEDLHLRTEQQIPSSWPKK